MFWKAVYLSVRVYFLPTFQERAVEYKIFFAPTYHDGLILERGNTLDVFASPSTPYARELVGSVPRLSRFHPVQQDSKEPEKKVGGSDTTQSL